MDEKELRQQSELLAKQASALRDLADGVLRQSRETVKMAREFEEQANSRPVEHKRDMDEHRARRPNRPDQMS